MIRKDSIRWSPRLLVEKFDQDATEWVAGKSGLLEPSGDLLSAYGVMPYETIEVEGNTIKLSGETIAPAISADEKVRTLRSEIGFGKFNRSFELPDDIDATKIDANLENGLLTVRVPKAEAVKPRSIKVQAK